MKLLQKIFSIKNEQGRKVFYLCGLKFKIKNKAEYLNYRLKEQQKELDRLKYLKDIHIFSFWNDDEYIICKSLWESFIRQIDTKDFYKICNKYFSGEDLKYFHPHEILICITAAIQNQKYEKASELLKKYLDIFNTSEIWRFIEVSKYALSCGIKDSLIEKSSFIYDKLKKNRSEKLFEKLLENKTVALVGNGPSEAGYGKGKEIDAHDIVIRINNYKIKGFEQDYGAKTDVWIKCSSDDIKHEIQDKDIKLIVYEPDYFRHPVIDGFLDPLADNSIPVDYFDFQDHTILRKKLNIFPSTGLVAIEKIISKCKVKQLDCYGFSFLQKEKYGYAKHYYNDRDDTEAKQRSLHHSFDKETEYLKSFFKNNRYINNNRGY